MPRSRRHTRRTPRSNPRGVLVLRSGGFGFVQTAEGEFFVPDNAMGGAFDGDLVELVPFADRGAKKGRNARRGFDGAGQNDCPSARVVRVLDRAHDTVVGRYEVAEPFGVVVPEDHRIPYDIFTMRADNPDIPDGVLVRVRITQFPSRNTAACGVIEEVLGTAEDRDRGIDLIVARHKFETRFSEAAVEQAKASALDAEDALAKGYRDIRERFVFTIDPADAKDFDDALSLDEVKVPLPFGADSSDGAPSRRLWRLGVHIADVSHYVPWGSACDMEARRRATSVYLPDRVIPMLPPELSDELCSLKPDEDRRAMTVDLYLDDTARVVDYDVYPALIRSNARLSYEQALAVLLDTDEAADEALARRLKVCSRLAKERSASRTQAGGIEFVSAEGKVLLDEDGVPTGVTVRRKTDATSLVEEAMILANETVASHLERHFWPCLYRVHEKPALDALAGLLPVLQEFPWYSERLGTRLLTGNPHAVQEVLDASRGRAEEELVSSLLLRSMKRALYRPENEGHYGLASACYCHFTSPIRRYPDLVVHRMLRYSLTKRPEKFDQEVAALPWLAEHSSDMERHADDAAREAQAYKLIELLEQHMGETFPGIVSGVTGFGLFVRLENTAEGIVPMRRLGDEYFVHDASRYALIGSESGRAFRLGQRLAVVVRVADRITGKLEFALASGKDHRFR